MSKQKDLNQEMAEFLLAWDGHKMTQFLRDAYEIFELYNIRPGKDWVADLVGEFDKDDVRVVRTIYLMSKLAQNFGAELLKLHCQFKGLPVRMEKAAADFKEKT